MTYNEFISGIINTRGQWTIPECGVYEAHHIIPRSLGGEPNHSSRTAHHPNLIWLSPYEHFTAHKLLYEENKENYSIRAAFMCMNLRTIKTIELTEDEINLLKSAAQEHNRETCIKYRELGRFGFNGHHHSDESKLKIGESCSGEKNGMYGKPSTYKMTEQEAKDYYKRLMLGSKKRIVIKCIETGEEFNSLREAGRKYSLDHNRIHRAIKSCRSIDGLTFVKIKE